MNYIQLRKNQLCIESLQANKIVKKYKTPFYCYSISQLKNNFKSFASAFKKIKPIICFSVKSNSNLTLLKELKKIGSGADVVSLGELLKALKAGIKAQKIVFSGVGKTKTEIEYAINKKILLINAESKSEILEIEKIAKSKKRKINIGIRLNPNTDAKTISQISTGKKDNKFGVDEKTFLNLVLYVKKSKNLNLKCLSVHIGSQILKNQPYSKMLTVIDKIITKSNRKLCPAHSEPWK